MHCKHNIISCFIVATVANYRTLRTKTKAIGITVTLLEKLWRVLTLVRDTTLILGSLVLFLEHSLQSSSDFYSELGYSAGPIMRPMEWSLHILSGAETYLLLESH